MTAGEDTVAPLLELSFSSILAFTWALGGISLLASVVSLPASVVVFSWDCTPSIGPEAKDGLEKLLAEESLGEATRGCFNAAVILCCIAWLAGVSATNVELWAEDWLRGIERDSGVDKTLTSVFGAANDCSGTAVGTAGVKLPRG